MWLHISVEHKFVTNYCGCIELLLDPVSFKLIDLSLSFLTFQPACIPAGENGSFVQSWSQLTKGGL